MSRKSAAEVFPCGFPLRVERRSAREAPGCQWRMGRRELLQGGEHVQGRLQRHVAEAAVDGVCVLVLEDTAAGEAATLTGLVVGLERLRHVAQGVVGLSYGKGSDGRTL